MPILDHFNPPLSIRRSWDSFQVTWTSCLVDALTASLPESYLVEEMPVGASAEIDEGTFDATAVLMSRQLPGHTPTMVASRACVIPAPALTMPAIFPGGLGIRIFSTKAGPTLVAVIELISPCIKGRPESRRALATRCASYLEQGVSLIMVDIVTTDCGNLHNETMRLMQADQRFELPPETGLYSVAYRPVRREQREEIDLWPVRFEVGDTLPEMPLFLNWETCVQVDLEAAYVDACRRRRLV